ncbi:class I SAM-dependent DNA methyltransferase [Thiospirillum jenense]|uniref:site-specific DNA-methyltransferase (adenine-specific) n=1 Tax=Thiospirillum jenense TaxID=1653858 RepID=A0A839HER7_9GAMM|nr:DNA methyltransferase [Thiospirillum jenense]MBB1125886.1 class I SAM-dependent DNA methyltransferase [Thiospirillum jenense]
MTPDEFIIKWQRTTLKESSAAQEHFCDLCQLLDELTPAAADPTGAVYCFEHGTIKTTGGKGWADVWKDGHFGWEYKSAGKNLDQALKRLQFYAPALNHPPLLIVSDMAQIIIHTVFTGTVPDQYTLTLNDLRDPSKLQLLKWAFSDPEKLRPIDTTAALTERAARQFSEWAAALRQRGHDSAAVAHFSQKLLFCLFAQDIGLLPNQLFTRLLENGLKYPAQVEQMLTSLLNTMAPGGLFGSEAIDWFNGGLFAEVQPLPLETADLKTLHSFTKLNWSAIEPSIFGTLFERGLDPKQRAQLGAHYTDPNSIMRLVAPVVLMPLRKEWQSVQKEMLQLKTAADAAKSPAVRDKQLTKLRALLTGMLERLNQFHVLDPACGSGNFLFLALKGLKDLEHEIILAGEQFGLMRAFPTVSPHNVLGIEKNHYAAELARVTVWIGEIQWMLQHGFSLSKNPILKPINIIEQRDAVVNADGSEPEWPTADVIIGNPPFLGGSKKRGLLGDDYFAALETIYDGRVPAGADLVCYWFEKARTQIETGKARAAGLVSTNSIRGGSNRKVLDQICQTTRIFNAWSDEPWVNDGAAVRVSLISFGEIKTPPVLNDERVAVIYADLTAGSSEIKMDVTTAKPLKENVRVSFQGTKKYGAFDICGDLARSWLQIPNPHGHPNSDVLKPWRNGKDITGHVSDTWIIDFGIDISEIQASLYEMPFQYLLDHVKSYRETVRREKTRRKWWIHEEARPGLRRAIKGYFRVIVTSLTAKHRFFVWLSTQILADQALIVISRADDTTFGILHSCFHQLWSLKMGTSLGTTPRYTPTTTFETFPFPIGLTPADTASHAIETLESGAIIPSVASEYRAHAIAIAEAAHQLNQLRNHWLNPPEWIDRVPEVVAGYPDRIIAKPDYAAQLKQRTLTNLYNQQPAWLVNAHQQLDQAVAAAYAWETELNEAAILQRLLQLNLARCASYIE